MNDDLGDRMKQYESACQNVCSNQYPLIIRLDGRAFHTFTKGLNKPFDYALQGLMHSTMKWITSRHTFNIGYTQSDEITLIKVCNKPETQLPFGGKTLKLTGILAAETSLHFNISLPHFLPQKYHKDFVGPVFDCRVFSVPTVAEAANCLRWRFKDCIRNSISTFAQSKFSHKSLQGKSTKQMLEMCPEWHNLSDETKYGLCAIKVADGYETKSFDMNLEWNNFLQILKL